MQYNWAGRQNLKFHKRYEGISLARCKCNNLLQNLACILPVNTTTTLYHGKKQSPDIRVRCRSNTFTFQIWIIWDVIIAIQNLYHHSNINMHFVSRPVIKGVDIPQFISCCYVEIEDHSVACFKCISVFEVWYHWTSVKSGAHMCFVDLWAYLDPTLSKSLVTRWYTATK